jgi:membrane-bound lytic murein transglycosylase B
MTATPAPRPARFLAVLSLLWVASLTPVLAATHPGQAELVREVARETGKSPQALNALLDGAKMQQGILDAISRPAEGKPWKDYRPIFLTDKRINDGVAFYREHRALLEQVGRQYGVAPQYIVAIVGVETSYGGNTGKYKVLDALVTLGLYYPPRAKFFREQLKELLSLPDNHLAGPLDTLTGSYAGAQGWGQFMPSSIRDYAVDEDGDGRIDLMNSLPDIVASVAHYFAEHGWQTGAPVALRALQGAAPDPVPEYANAPPAAPVEQFTAAGYAPSAAVDPGLPASLLTLQGGTGAEYWLTFQNFYVITRYNKSPRYAMAVMQLAQQIEQDATQPMETAAAEAAR